jgi:Ca-activated chloride channel family protein
VNLPERLSLQGRVRYLPVGESGNNQAISLITLEPAADGNSLTAFVQVVNYNTEPVERRLTLTANGQLVDAHDLEIPAQGQAAVISERLPLETSVLEAALTETDALSLDDRAWAVQQVSGLQNITLVSEGNRFLETALGLFPNLEITTLRPDDYLATGRSDQATTPANLTIFDSHTPTETLPTGNLFFIGPAASSPVFNVAGSLETPVPEPIDADDPLLRHVDLSSVSILDAAQIPLPDWAHPVLIDQNSGAALLFVGEKQGQRIAVLAFDPRHSDLPLQVAYPILMANLVDWLLPGRIGEIPDQIKPGEAVTFTPPPDVDALKVTRPDGSGTQLEIQEGHAIFADTNQLGVYSVSWGEDQSLTFAVNLSNPQESDIKPVESLPLLESTSDAENGPAQQARREWWRPLAAIALLVLTIEWLVYNRATLSKLRTEIMQTAKSQRTT